MARVLICEDDARYRRLLARVLTDADHHVVGQVSSGEEACQEALRCAPELLLLDLELPGISGHDVIRQVCPAGASVEVLVLTSFADQARVFEAIRDGAAGYLVKGLPPTRLLAAIDQVLAGGSVIEPRLARRFWNLFASARGHGGPDYSLTAEELEVLTLVGRGLSNPEAADALGASRRSVKAVLERVYRKLGVNGRVEATVKALRAGLIEL